MRVRIWLKAFVVCLISSAPENFNSGASNPLPNVSAIMANLFKGLICLFIKKQEKKSNTTDANGANVSQADGEYYNLNTKTGWYVDSFETNEQSATIPEFLEKEGKWFNYIRGVATVHTNDSADLSVTSSNLDQQEFSVQGIGVPSAIADSGDLPGNIYKLTVLNNTSTTYETDGGSGGTDWDSTAD